MGNLLPSQEIGDLFQRAQVFYKDDHSCSACAADQLEQDPCSCWVSSMERDRLRMALDLLLVIKKKVLFGQHACEGQFYRPGRRAGLGQGDVLSNSLLPIPSVPG